jgi:hypothetical protein
LALVGNRLRLTVALACVAALAPLVLAAMGDAAGSPTYAPKDCTKPKVEPSRIVLACADFGLFVRATHWNHWGGRRASGRGTLHANECVPAASCGPSQFRRYRHVRFRLHRVREKRCGGERVHLFTRLNLRFKRRDKPSYAHTIRRNRLYCKP